MQFGVMTLQLEKLIPADAAPQAVMSALGAFDHARLAQGLLDVGLNPIELSGDLCLFLPQAYTPQAIAGLMALKEKGARFSVHLPLWSVEPSTPLSPVREGSVKAMVDVILATKALQPEAYVLHATGALAAEFYNMKLPDLAKSILLKQFQAAASASIQQILAQTGIDSRRLAVETIEFPLDLTLELVEQHDLSVCLDVGHVMAGFCGWYDLFDVLERVLPRLAEVHLHDCKQMPEGVRGYGEDHKPLGTADLPLGRLLDRLHSANFTGPIIMELNLSEALHSLQVIRAARPQYLP